MKWLMSIIISAIISVILAKLWEEYKELIVEKALAYLPDITIGTGGDETSADLGAGHLPH